MSDHHSCKSTKNMLFTNPLLITINHDETTIAYIHASSNRSLSTTNHSVTIYPPIRVIYRHVSITYHNVPTQSSVQ